MTKNNDSNKVISGIRWSIIKIISVQIINFLTIVILARALSPSDFGIVALANLCINFLTLISVQN